MQCDTALTNVHQNVTPDQPFEMLESLTLTLLFGETVTKIAVTHVVLDPWCDQPTPSGSVQCDGTLESCLRTTFAWLRDIHVDVHPAILVYGVRDAAGSAVREANIRTLRQYGSSMGATVMHIDLSPAHQNARSILLLPARSWKVAPRSVWSAMAVQLLLGSTPGEELRAKPLPQRRAARRYKDGVPRSS